MTNSQMEVLVAHLNVSSELVTALTLLLIAKFPRILVQATNSTLPQRTSSSSETSTEDYYDIFNSTINSSCSDCEYYDRSVELNIESTSVLALSRQALGRVERATQFPEGYLVFADNTSAFDLNETAWVESVGPRPEEVQPEHNWPFLLLGILVVVGVLGNVLVCMAICLERRLQNATNYFLLSLAVADLLVSILVMPIAILDVFYGAWPFGSYICNLWTTCDVLCCTSSIMHMCFISVGRYLGIRNPLHARQALLVSRRAVIIKIGFAWFLSALITSPITILALADQSNVYQEEPTSACTISNRYFLFLASFSAFYLPMLVMVNSYILTVRLLSRKAKFYQDATIEGRRADCDPVESCEGHAEDEPRRISSPSSATHRSGDGNENGSGFGARVDQEALTKKTASVTSDSSFGTSPANSQFGAKSKLHQPASSRDFPKTRSYSSLRRPRGHFVERAALKKRSQRPTSQTSPNRDKPHRKPADESRYNTQPLMIRTLGSSLQVRTEQKATKVLGLVFFVFVICWTPFFTHNVLVALMPELNIPQYLPITFLWLGYLSSTMNPIIYTIFNRNFRRTFRRILLCQMFGASPGSLARKASHFESMHTSRLRQQRPRKSFPRNACHEQTADHGHGLQGADGTRHRLDGDKPAISMDEREMRPSPPRLPTSRSQPSLAELRRGQAPSSPSATWEGHSPSPGPQTWRFVPSSGRANIGTAYTCSQL